MGCRGPQGREALQKPFSKAGMGFFVMGGPKPIVHLVFFKRPGLMVRGE
jgi:hypothetical protein